VTGAGATLAAVDDFVGGFLGYEERMLNVLAAADAEPGHCLANAYAGMIWMFLESPEAPARAAAYLARARAAAAGATARERGNVALLEAWAADDVERATRVAGEVVAAHPRDLAVVKLHQYFDFNRGRCASMLRVALAALPHAGDVPQLHGMAAFAYEQCHLLDEAESCARQALAMRRREPWAQHALAHVALTRGTIREGLAFLESVRDTWGGLTSFMYTHNWWHLALFYLSEGREREALAAYDDHVWARDRAYSQDQVGAVSLLARLELAGVDVGDRWRALGEHLAPRAADVVQPFLTMQYLYGLARAGRPEADALLDAVRRHAATAPEAVRAAWAEVALPACEGLLAHARGDCATTRRRLGPALARMLEIGGSHAQRDLFEQVYLDATIRCGELGLAQQMLERRRAHEPDGVPPNRALAEVYARLGLPGEAARAASRARRPTATAQA
jgi:tetratricopeptide (TPR) repeat protein